jgi:hypothetical protein
LNRTSYEAPHYAVFSRKKRNFFRKLCNKKFIICTCHLVLELEMSSTQTRVGVANPYGIFAKGEIQSEDVVSELL